MQSNKDQKLKNKTWNKQYVTFTNETKRSGGKDYFI